LSPSVPGEVRDDSKHSWNLKKEFQITDKQYDAVKKSVEKDEKKPPQYDLNTNNCTDWVEQKAATGGVTLPDTQGSWPGGGGSNPGQLGEELKKQGATENPSQADLADEPWSRSLARTRGFSLPRTASYGTVHRSSRITGNLVIR
jgi:hypothetical protein